MSLLLCWFFFFFFQIDITNGFTTNLLFRHHRKVAILIAPSSFSNASYVSLASRKEARKFAVFTYLNRFVEQTHKILANLLGAKRNEHSKKIEFLSHS